MTNKYDIILASASPRRLDLLKQLKIVPKQVIAADINESPIKNEKPKNLALRLAEEKARVIHKQKPETYILAADTVVACGSQILDKAENKDQALEYLKKLSGKRHHVHGGIALITSEGRVFMRHCDTIVQFKRLSDTEISAYIRSQEWEGKAGGYAIQGLAGGFIKFI